MADVDRPVPMVSVLVPALNCADDVAGFVSAMRQQDYPPARFEVIVVDNGSTDGTFEALVAAGITVLRCPERGRTRALNTGLSAACGELILTTDLSCRAEPSWIRTVVETFDAYPQAACVAGEIKMRGMTNNAALRFQQRTDYMSPLHAVNRRRPPYLPFADGANASFRRALLDEIGGFESKFLKAGDVEICYRILVLTDYAIVFNSAACVWEPGESTLWALLRQRFRIGLGLNLMTMKYPTLYALAAGDTSLRGRWWQVRGVAARFASLINSNAKAAMGAGLARDAAADANIRWLMDVAQRLGILWGKWHLWRKDLGVKPIDQRRMDDFLRRADPLAGRVIVINASDQEHLRLAH